MASHELVRSVTQEKSRKARISVQTWSGNAHIKKRDQSPCFEYRFILFSMRQQKQAGVSCWQKPTQNPGVQCPSSNRRFINYLACGSGGSVSSESLRKVRRSLAIPILILLENNNTTPEMTPKRTIRVWARIPPVFGSIYITNSLHSNCTCSLYRNKIML